MDKAAVGIDVAKETLDVVLKQGDLSRHATFKNTDAGYAQLEKWLVKYQAVGVPVCMEATGQYSDGVAEYLHQQGYPVSVVNPKRIKAYGESQLKRNKTDKLDAYLIADFCGRQNPPVWNPPPENVRHLRELVRRLDDLQGIRQQERNRLKAGKLASEVREDLEAHIQHLDQRMRAIERRIADLVAQDPQLKQMFDLLISIPGIGAKTAYGLISEIPLLGQYKHVNELIAFCGINPRLRRSGTSINAVPRLSKIGSSSIRKALFFPAIVAMKHNPIIAAFSERLLKKGKSKMCVIGAAMRKLMHLVFGVLKTGQPFDPNYGNFVAAHP